jgi:membrane protein YqaA with SNARE-associated domain
LVVVFSTLGGILLGYFAGQIMFGSGAHAVHWSVAALGGIVGWALGRLYYRRRGDIV